MQQVAHDAPEDEEDDVGAGDEGMLDGSGEVLSTMPLFLYSGYQQGNQVWDADDEEIVVGEGFLKTTVQQGMQSALKSTGWAVPASEQTERALGHPRMPGGVEKGVNNNSSHCYQQQEDEPEGAFHELSQIRSWQSMR